MKPKSLTANHHKESAAGEFEQLTAGGGAGVTNIFSNPLHFAATLNLPNHKPQTLQGPLPIDPKHLKITGQWRNTVAKCLHTILSSESAKCRVEKCLHTIWSVAYHCRALIRDIPRISVYFLITNIRRNGCQPTHPIYQGGNAAETD